MFDHVSVWYAHRADLLLLGFDRPDRALDVRALAARFEREDFAAGFARCGIENFPALLAHELLPLGTVNAAELQGPIHTLRDPILSDMAARAFFVGLRARLPKLATPAGARVGQQNSLLRRYAGVVNGSLPETVLAPAAREACSRERRMECPTLLARWRRDDGESQALDSLITRLRLEDPENARFLDPGRLDLLQLLFGTRRLRRPPDGESLERADSMSKRFLHHYHHAIPFDRGVLAAAWRACHDEGCEDARRVVEAQVGPLARTPSGPRRRARGARR